MQQQFPSSCLNTAALMHVSSSQCMQLGVLLSGRLIDHMHGSCRLKVFRHLRHVS